MTERRASARRLVDAAALAVRGESVPLHRGERCARLAMSRSARISGIFGRLSEEVQAGCSVRRMPADFHHGLLLFLVILMGATRARAQTPAASDGWQIPASAATETNPIPATPATIARGKELFMAKCRRCHGATGKGNGPEADPDHPSGDLTDASRASRNPDGVMFYKIWNGRAKPKMPAIKSDASRDEVWALIHYIKTLRQ
jgi:mono/diheme cytochrome c family protein